MIDPKTIKGHNAIHALSEYYAHCLSEAAQQIEALQEKLELAEKEIAVLRATLHGGGS